MKSTNYYDTFIEVAEDCPANKAEVPPVRGDKRSVANIQFDILKDSSYQYTSDEVLFQTHAQKNAISQKNMEAEKEKFFSKGQPCFRCSPLTKRYGWGIHSDSNGKIALVALESDEYQKMKTDERLTVKKAMRSKKV